VSRPRALGLLLLLLAAPALSQEEQFFAPEAASRWQFRWDALARYDHVWNLPRASIERGRFELRPQLAYHVSDRFQLGVRIVGEYGTDDRAENARSFDNYLSDSVRLDRAYLQARPGAFTIDAGVFGLPVTASEMLWDLDIQTPGLAVAWETPLTDSFLRFSAGAFLGPQHSGDETQVFVGQAAWRAAEGSGLRPEVALSYWGLEPEELAGSFLRQNRGAIVGGRAAYASDFQIVDLLVRFRFAVGSIPVVVTVDGAHNFGAFDDSEDDALEAGIAIGKQGAPWNVRYFYVYQHIGRDAVLGAYNTDDWWFHSWAEGHRTGLSVTVAPLLVVRGALVFQRRLDLDTYVSRVTIDLAKLF
jgi:hypothetical protein